MFSMCIGGWVGVHTHMHVTIIIQEKEAILLREG